MARDIIAGAAGTGKLPPLRSIPTRDKDGTQQSQMPPGVSANAGVQVPAARTGMRDQTANRFARTRTLDGFSGSREWQAAVERLAGGQAQQGAEKSGLARPAAAAPRSATRVPARFKPETEDDDVPEYRGAMRLANQAVKDLTAAFTDDPATLAALRQLEASGTLETRDSKGNSIQEQLLDLLQRPQLPGMPANKQLVSELIDSMAHPHAIGQGEGTFTCTAATVQITLAGNNPAEYVRIMHGLLVDGSVKTIGGDTLVASLDGLADQEGRSAIRGHFQESVMNLGNRMVAKGDERIGNGAFGREPRRFGNDEAVGEGGLTAGQFEAISRSLTGQNLVGFEPVQDFPLDRMQDLFADLLKVGKGAVQVGIKAVDQEGNPTSHAVVVTGYKNGTVTIVDPGTGSREVMSEQEFKNRLELVFVDIGDIGKIARKVPDPPLRQAADSALARRLNPSRLAFARTRFLDDAKTTSARRRSAYPALADRIVARLGTRATVTYKRGTRDTRTVVAGGDHLANRRLANRRRVN